MEAAPNFVFFSGELILQIAAGLIIVGCHCACLVEAMRRM